MADDNVTAIATTSRPRKRTCVALAQDTAEGVERDKAVVIGNCVSEGAVRRSGLLSGIEDAEGLASLPGHLSPEDVRLWETACFIGGSFPVDEVVTVLKVADALCDADVSKWRAMLAEKALATDWQQPQQADSMLCSLLHLPPHLLQSVMSECRSQRIGHSFSMLATFPHSLHPAIIQAAFWEGCLYIDCQESAAVLAFLPCIKFPAPGLQSLSIRPNDNDVAHSDPSVAVPALLGQALSAHPSLTSLHLSHLSPLLPPPWIRSLSSCLAPGALPRLADLTLRSDASPSGCAQLAACLRRLPALTSLTLALAHPDEPAAEEVSLTTYTRLAASPASLPNLHRLSLKEVFTYRGGIRHPDSRTPALMSLLAAPALEDLKIRLYPSLTSAQPFFSHVLRFTCLRKVSIDARLRWGDFRVAASDVGALQGTLPALASVTVDSECPVSAVYVATAFAKLAAGSLTSLELAHSRRMVPFDDQKLRTVAKVLAGWTKLSPALSRCSSLKALSLTAVGCAPGSTFSYHLATALQSLGQLQTLTLSPVEHSAAMPLCPSAIARGLEQLTSLVTLIFEHCPDVDSYADRDLSVKFQFGSVTPVLRALEKLQRVTRLQLHFDGITEPLLVKLLKKMPALRSLSVLSTALKKRRPESDLSPELEMQERFPHVQIVSVPP